MLGAFDKSYEPKSSPFTIKLSVFLSIASINLFIFIDKSISSLFKSVSNFSIQTVLNILQVSVKLSISISCSNGISSLILYTDFNPSTGTYNISTFIIPSIMLLSPCT